ncbi:MAG: NADH-quinone oxidoreductase subunit J [Candidatus Competibacteraceae bacterium]|nr:NADH-quinone oxidoreductase subunit J [Candidatus Competibacteraceae bacterium]
MGFEKFLFYLFALVLIFAAVRVITVRNSVHAALFLVLAFFTSAALWLLIEAAREGFIQYLPVGAAIAVIIVVEMALVVGSNYFSSNQYALISRAADYSNTKELGSVLYTFYVYPFEIASVILLVAIVAAISLTLRRREGSKSQNPSQQIRVSRDDRVRLVRMAAEKK